MIEPWEIGDFCSVIVNGGHKESMIEIYSDYGVIAYVVDPDDAPIVAAGPLLADAVKKLLGELQQGRDSVSDDTIEELWDIMLSLPSPHGKGNEVMSFVTPKDDGDSLPEGRGPAEYDSMPPMQAMVQDAINTQPDDDAE